MLEWKGLCYCTCAKNWTACTKHSRSESNSYTWLVSLSQVDNSSSLSSSSFHSKIVIRTQNQSMVWICTVSDGVSGANFLELLIMFMLLHMVTTLLNSWFIVLNKIVAMSNFLLHSLQLLCLMEHEPLSFAYYLFKNLNGHELFLQNFKAWETFNELLRVRFFV